MMLPCLEQQATYNSCNFSVVNQGGIDGNMNSTATATTINAFLCPSSPRLNGGQWGSYYGSPYPNVNYFASVGSSLCQYGGNPAGVAFQDASGNSAAPNGVFEVFGPVFSIANITDGTSNTIAFGEWRSGDGQQGILTIPQEHLVRVGGNLPAGMSLGPIMNMPLGGAYLNAWLQGCTAQRPRHSRHFK